ncbi:MAG: heavy-metal-associated domain-containing protein [Myxococcota bacterium]
MFRVLTVAVGLAFATPALACGGKPCAECDHAATGAVDFTKVDQAAGTKLSLGIDGMKCGNCSSKVTAAISAVPGVIAVVVSHETGEARVAYDAAKTTPDALKKAVTDTGFALRAPKAG